MKSLLECKLDIIRFIADGVTEYAMRSYYAYDDLNSKLYEQSVSALINFEVIEFRDEMYYLTSLGKLVGVNYVGILYAIGEE